MTFRNQAFAVLVAVGVLAAAPAGAQTNEPWLAPANSDKLLGELQALIAKGETEKLAQTKYLNELKQLAARYDWPWTRLLLLEEFADGNYSANPPWTVRSGQFQLDANFGLVSIQNQPQQQAETSQPGQAQTNVGQQLLGAVLQQVLTPQTTQQQQEAAPPAATRGDIYTPLKITDGFDIRIVMRSRNEPGRFEFGPYISGQSDAGYRLVYAPGGNPSFALMRYSSIGSGVVAVAQNPVSLTEGENHYVQWFRHTNGDMAVYVDGKEAIVTNDRTFNKGFDGFIVSNLGGTYTMGKIAVYGTK